jgi:hypothetical protein
MLSLAHAEMHEGGVTILYQSGQGSSLGTER